MSDRLLVLVRHGQSEWNLKNLFTGWRDVDLTEKGIGEARAALVKAAVYAYFIQRELCGLRRHDEIIRDYAIPREVLVRLGAR